MKVKIDKLRYFKCGFSAPKNSSFKGTMTTDSLIEYSEYTGREEAKENDKHLEANESGYFGYTVSHHAGCTRSSIGLLDSKEKIKEFRKEIELCFHSKGDLAWENVLSIADFSEAEKYGLFTIEDWEIALNKALPKFFKYAGFKEDNTVWWWDYHINKFHPHVHIIWTEKVKLHKEGYLPPRYLKALKRYTALELMARKELLDQIDTTYNEFFKNKDLEFKEIITNIDNYLQNHIDQDIRDLYQILPRQGRLQYNSYNMKDYKPIIDKIIQRILDIPEVKVDYDSWLTTLDQLKENMNKINASDIDSFKEAELKKLYTRIGNRILKTYRTTEFSADKSFHENGNKEDEKRIQNKFRFYSKINKYYRKSSYTKILGVYCMDVIAEQKREMEESLYEFLQTNDLEIT